MKIMDKIKNQEKLSDTLPVSIKINVGDVKKMQIYIRLLYTISGSCRVNTRKCQPSSVGSAVATSVANIVFI